MLLPTTACKVTEIDESDALAVLFCMTTGDVGRGFAVDRETNGLSEEEFTDTVVVVAAVPEDCGKAGAVNNPTGETSCGNELFSDTKGDANKTGGATADGVDLPNDIDPLLTGITGDSEAKEASTEDAISAPTNDVGTVDVSVLTKTAEEPEGTGAATEEAAAPTVSPAEPTTDMVGGVDAVEGADPLLTETAGEAEVTDNATEEEVGPAAVSAAGPPTTSVATPFTSSAS